MDLLLLLDALTWMQWVGFSIAINSLLVLLSIGLFLLIENLYSKAKLQNTAHPIYKADLLLSIVTLLLNSLVMLLGAYLWKTGYLVLQPVSSVGIIILEILGIILMMDFLMYVFHYIAHIPFVYKILHAKHHEHVSTNCISLFVLHPLESLGFGVMMIGVFLVYDFSFVSISAYVIINLIWGTVGHLNKEFFPKWAEAVFLGTTKFHNQHHQQEDYNFGFYTSIWDRLFNTYKKKEA